HHTGIGDWFFRQAAFPELPDNASEYFGRYYPTTSIKDEVFRRLILERRSRLDALLDDLIDRYQLADRDLVGFTSMFAQIVACFALARRLKAGRPGIVTIMGGANCETVMGREIVRQIDVIDFVFSGPALVTLPDFVGCQIEGDDDACHRIDGIFSRRNVAAGSSFTPAPLGAELPIDVPVGLDYDSFLRSLEERFHPGDVTPALFFETSRGCWWGQRAHCTFCGLNGTTMSYRAMSPAHALEYFEQLFAYAPRCLRFHSVDNIMPKSYPSEVFAVLSPPPNVE